MAHNWHEAVDSLMMRISAMNISDWQGECLGIKVSDVVLNVLFRMQ